MIGLVLLAIAGQVAAQPPAPSLPELLARLGEAEAHDVDSPSPCRYTDTTTIEELDGKGGVAAREIYVWEVERLEQTSRRQLGVEVQGDLSEVLKPDLERLDKVRRSAFHPEEQRHFRFRLFGGSDPSTVNIQYAPLVPDPERMTGFAEVDLATMTVRALLVKPSKMPAFVSALELRIDFGMTECGHMPLRIAVKGEGGFLFFRTLFRSFTELGTFRLVRRDPPTAHEVH